MASSWKEHVLEEIPVVDSDVGDAVTCLLHTILFTRAPGPVRPSEATCHAFPNISYSLCAVGDVSRKVEHAVKSLEETLQPAATATSSGGGGSYGLDASGGYGGYGGYTQRGSGYSNSQRLSFGNGAPPPLPPVASNSSTMGCIVVAFFERKVKKALFGLMSNEEKIYFEKWIVPVHVSAMPRSPTHQENATRSTEMALQNALLHILSAVQTIDHVPSTMYDFEITQFASLEAMQSESGGNTYGLGLQGNTSVRLMA